MRSPLVSAIPRAYLATSHVIPPLHYVLAVGAVLSVAACSGMDIGPVPQCSAYAPNCSSFGPEPAPATPPNAAASLPPAAPQPSSGASSSP